MIVLRFTKGIEGNIYEKTRIPIKGKVLASFKIIRFWSNLKIFGAFKILSCLQPTSERFLLNSNGPIYRMRPPLNCEDPGYFE